MAFWFIAIVSLFAAVLIRTILSATTKTTIPLPPSPPHIPIISNILWLRKAFSLEPYLRSLHAKYGPIVSLQIGSRPSIFIADHSLAHHALVQNASVFSDRPKALLTGNFMSGNQHNIVSSFYGPNWSILRRNFANEMLSPSHVKSFSQIRKLVLQTLLNRLNSEKSKSDSVTVVTHFRYAMFSVLVFMCFGERLSDEKILEIERVQRAILLNLYRFNVLNFMPKVTKILFRKRLEEMIKLFQDQEDVLLPLIRAREVAKQSKLNNDVNDVKDVNNVVYYVDTLLNLELPEEKRKMNDVELITLTSEFLNAGTNTSMTALQWIMANLVKYRHVQERVVEEIKAVMGGGGGGDDGEKKEVKEEDLQKLPYLKCVVLEGLRRHPPMHFLEPHAVKEDVVFNGNLVPKDANVNFLVAEMGWDPQVWEDPMEFKPERFLKEEAFDITGAKEIKMLPFGAGRRICPGINLALLHLEYFVANLVWNFDWKVPKGEYVDLSEKLEFTTVMKNPLKVHLHPRT